VFAVTFKPKYASNTNQAMIYKNALMLYIFSLENALINISKYNEIAKIQYLSVLIGAFCNKIYVACFCAFKKCQYQSSKSQAYLISFDDYNK